MAQKKSNWIQGAIKHPGALTAKAKKAGELTPKGTIKQSYINKQAKGKGATAKQAQLAKTLKKINK